MADQATEGVLSPFLKRQRIFAVRESIKGRVLDVGCGNGALAELVDSRNYVGIDLDPVSIAAARKKYPSHKFVQAEHLAVGVFDTIAALAVIEHVKDPRTFLATLKSNLVRAPAARIVCTTPHPSMDWVHWVGSRIGVFSRSANEEHEDLLDKKKLSDAGRSVGLKMVSYRRFLFGANQVFSFTHDDL
ncbi:class I SAM-dependent methyltransferase [Mesorhizobium sp. BR1-1-7]|uniref:class I SAM-dependent methyltransferase n=1 Tax=Mesorhizobium sp. BR1-1-7 TaxID=2876647 RepID=UPI001CCD12AC|nr:class I SAM-dependent methyltransferase [Mesorhizobium sp. BR1-1-7]MBZ9922624.1 class I SAM-dependent methyltransferase [Mesorhizobium sp. BR1-1-7]